MTKVLLCQTTVGEEKPVTVNDFVGGESIATLVGENSINLAHYDGIHATTYLTNCTVADMDVSQLIELSNNGTLSLGAPTQIRQQAEIDGQTQDVYTSVPVYNLNSLREGHLSEIVGNRAIYDPNDRTGVFQITHDVSFHNPNGEDARHTIREVNDYDAHGLTGDEASFAIYNQIKDIMDQTHTANKMARMDTASPENANQISQLTPTPLTLGG